MRALRFAIVAATLVAATYAVPVGATAYSIDQSDLWWNPNESGWGIQFINHATTIFATMFVYGPAPSSAPTWYTATLTATSPQSWTGDLLATTGPPFANPNFDPNTVTRRTVGTMTWTTSSATAGALNYVVDGVQVNKSLVRTPMPLEDYSGTFLGAIHETQSNCSNPAKNGTFEDFATVTIVQNGASGTLTVTPQTGNGCIAVGTLNQDGRFGTFTAPAGCNGGPGSLVLSQMTVGVNDLALHFEGIDNSNGCKASGDFSGERHH
jgi:hypothetical protein